MVGSIADTGSPTAEIDASAPAAAPIDAGTDAWVLATPVLEPPVEVGEAGAQALVDRAEGLPDPDAEALYRQALTLDPRNHYAMLGIAAVLMRRNSPQEAIGFLESAVRRRGRRPEYRVLLGDARRAAGDEEGARAAWRQALEIDPNDHDAHARLSQ